MNRNTHGQITNVHIVYSKIVREQTPLGM